MEHIHEGSTTKYAYATEWARQDRLRIGLFEDLGQVFPDEVGALSSVDGNPQTLLAVIVNDGPSLFVVRNETLREGLHVVVRALDEWFTGDVVGEGFLGRALQSH